MRDESISGRARQEPDAPQQKDIAPEGAEAAPDRAPQTVSEPETAEAQPQEAQPETKGEQAAQSAPAEEAPSEAPPEAPPAPPPLTLRRQTLCLTAAAVIGVAQGLGLSLLSSNTLQIQGAIGTTTAESAWLTAAYMAPNASLTLALIKLRMQYGLRPFAELSILFFVGASLLNLVITDMPSAIFVRFASGCAAAPLSTLTVLYCLEAFPREKKLTSGLALALLFITIGTPLARLISPHVLAGYHLRGLSMIEAGMALMAFAFVYLLPLTPTPREKVIHWIDIVSYLFIAVGLGLFAIVLTLGRYDWWFDAPWLGWSLAAAVISLTAAVAIELNRTNPLIDIRWLLTPAMLHFTGALILFRIVLAEQTVGTPGFFQALGLTNQQCTTLYAVILCASISGGLLCAWAMAEFADEWVHAFALALLAGGAWLDSQATSLTRPDDVLLSQSMIAFASALFLPPVMRTGLVAALQKGPSYLLSFVIVFLTTQRLGSLMGSALFSTFVQHRQTVHGNWLKAQLASSDPLVVTRVSQYAASYASAIPNSATRQSAGLSLLNTAVSTQSTVLAYNDAFRLITHLAVIALAMLFGHVGLRALWRRHRAAADLPPAGAAA